MRVHAAALFALLAATAACEQELPSQAWRLVEQQALPGPLSTSHAALAGDCGACHTPIRGVEAASCIACHALNGSLVAQQTTAFHASASECAGCHVEHAGAAALRGPMDHQRFAQLAASNDPAPRRRAQDLACLQCHERQDPHSALFGRDCAACHATERWAIDEYRHPSAQSRDCAQCHQAPPSHFMEHFAMVSQRVARQEHASVAECYRCHLPTHWNDIRGVGFYDHH